MVDRNRMILDELMGKNRNLPSKLREKQKEHYSDENVPLFVFKQLQRFAKIF